MMDALGAGLDCCNSEYWTINICSMGLYYVGTKRSHADDMDEAALRNPVVQRMVIDSKIPRVKTSANMR